jgi:predicted type IV restriction endonuclease
MAIGAAEAPTWNEETLRTHVLMPFLEALGLSPTSVHVEWKFSVRLGRTINGVDGTPAEGRADALIKNGAGDNLFVVELKRPDNKLKDNDRDQGISYARLLDQIAPFVVVSNGKETQIFDTITKEQLDGKTFHTKSQLFNGGALLSGEDIRIRFEALEYFIAFSEANVSAFSKAQIEVSTRALRERADGPHNCVGFVRKFTFLLDKNY